MEESPADDSQELKRGELIVPEVSTEGLSMILDLAAGKLIDAEQLDQTEDLPASAVSFRKAELRSEVDDIIRTLDIVIPISDEQSWGDLIHGRADKHPEA
jgi:hypothetical protein